MSQCLSVVARLHSKVVGRCGLGVGLKMFAKISCQFAVMSVVAILHPKVEGQCGGEKT